MLFLKKKNGLPVEKLSRRQFSVTGKGAVEYKDVDFIKSFEATLINKYKEKEDELGKFAVKTTNNVADLEAEKLQKIDAFSGTQNKTIRETLERQIDEIQKQITETQQQGNKLEVSKTESPGIIYIVEAGVMVADGNVLT